VPNGEKVLLKCIEEKFIEKGFTMAQYSAFWWCVGQHQRIPQRSFLQGIVRSLELVYVLPKTPFTAPDLWSGTRFDCYTHYLYKWDRDKLLRIRSVYIENRERMFNRQTDLRNSAFNSFRTKRSW
jgi:hypothetical protein